jgi:hypothetical protein
MSFLQLLNLIIRDDTFHKNEPSNVKQGKKKCIKGLQKSLLFFQNFTLFVKNGSIKSIPKSKGTEIKKENYKLL